jgi:hypothetical protein
MAKGLNYSKVYITTKFTAPATKELDTQKLAYLQRFIEQSMKAMNKRLNEQMFGNWPLWIGLDGKEYFNWSDLPDKELLRARLTGKYKLGE